MTQPNNLDRPFFVRRFSKRMVTDIAELSKHWAGSFVLIWQPPIGYKGSLRKGHKGQVVSWLSRRLAKIEGTGYTGGISERVFGSEHARAVKRLQGKNNLESDGIAGKETLIVVNSLSGAKIPYLKIVEL